MSFLVDETILNLSFSPTVIIIGIFTMLLILGVVLISARLIYLWSRKDKTAFNLCWSNSEDLLLSLLRSIPVVLILWFLYFKFLY